MEKRSQTVPIGPLYEAIGELYMSNRMLAIKVQEQEKFLNEFEKENRTLKAVESKASKGK